MSLYREFKRRKAFRVAVAYAGPACAVVEAADLVLPRMGVPDWATSLVNALARLPDLHVASRTGSFQFRDHAADVRAIADSLGAPTSSKARTPRT